MAAAGADETSKEAGAAAASASASREDGIFISGVSFGGIEQVEVGEGGRGPAEAGLLKEARGELRLAMFREQRVDPLLGGGVGRAAERERDRPEPKLEQPVAAPGLEVIIALGRRPRDQLDLPLVEAEALIGGARLRLDRAVVGQEDALRAAL